MKGRELKYRINAVEETVKITRAMETIAASKLSKAQLKYESSLKYVQEVKKSIRLLMTPKVKSHPYFDQHGGNLRIVYIVIASDKGLCGDFNNAVLDAVYQHMQPRNVVNIFAVGHMAVDFFRKKGINVDHAYVHMMQNPITEDARIVTDDLIKIFTEESIDKVYLVFTELETLSNHKVTIKKILPVNYVEQETDTPVLTGSSNISNMLNHYVWAEVYYGLAASHLAYNYKTMSAMRQSTDNGEDIIEELKKEYNHKRQESITTELMDSSFSGTGKRL